MLRVDIRFPVLVLSLLVAVLACRKEAASETDVHSVGTAKKQAVTIWWAQWAPSDGLQALGKEYEKETGVTVKVHQIPWSSFQDQVFLNFGNRTTSFDIVVGDSQWLGRGATDKLYLELTDWLSKAVDMKSIHPQALQYLCEYPTGSGRYFAAPAETDAVGFAYRRDWFEDEGEKAAFEAKYKRALAVPQTWDELRQVAEFFHRPAEKRYGAALLTGRGYDSLVMGFQQILWAYGGSWGDRETFQVKGHLDKPEAVEALKFQRALLGYAPPNGANLDYGKVLEAFVSGSVAMAMDYFAFFPKIVSDMGDRAGFFVVPARGERRFSSLGGQGMSISTKVPEAQQKLAKDFIAWFLKRETQERWITKEAGFTANTEVLASEAFTKRTAYNAPLAESMNYLKDFWNVPPYNELLASATQRLGQALDGEMTEKAALEALAVEHERIFKEAGLVR
jgi:multiple sugar transport system substrate-binding protein